MTVKKFCLSLLKFLAVILLFLVLCYSWKGYRLGMDDKAIAKRLQPITLHLEKQQITVYRNQDWCSYFKYNKGLFSKNPEDERCNVAFSRELVKPFPATAQQDFNDLKQKLLLTGINIRMIEAEFDNTGYQPRLTKATFHVSQSFHRLYYIYEPNHQISEGGIEGEIWDTPINKNWYREDEDWN